MPQNEVPLSLLMFNVGVELGQVLFVSVVATILLLLKRVKKLNLESLWKVTPYAVGSIAAYWTIERTLSFLPIGVGVY